MKKTYKVTFRHIYGGKTEFMYVEAKNRKHLMLIVDDAFRYNGFNKRSEYNIINITEF